MASVGDHAPAEILFLLIFLPRQTFAKWPFSDNYNKLHHGQGILNERKKGSNNSAVVSLFSLPPPYEPMNKLLFGAMNINKRSNRPFQLQVN